MIFKKRGLLIKILILGCLVYLGFIDRASFLNVFRSQVKRDKLKAKIAEYNSDNNVLDSTNKALANDRVAWEKLAREKLGMQKKGEKVYRFYRESKNSISNK